MVALISNDEVLLAGQRLKVIGPVTTSPLVQFPAKLVIGDPTRADDPLASSQVYGSWGGGLLIDQMDPTKDFDRFWWSTLWTMTNRQLTLLPEVTWLGSAGLLDRHVRAGAELNGVLYFAFDEKLVKLNPDDTLTVVGTMASAAREMIVWRIATGASAGQSRLVIACENTYYVFDGGTLTQGSERARSLAVWDERLVKLDDNNQLRYTNDLATWQNLPGQYQVPLPSGEAQRLLVFPNDAGEDALHIATEEGLYFYDDSSQRIRPTKVRLPRLREQGSASTVWQDNLYFGGGSLQVLRYAGTTLTPEGLDRDYGLPGDRRGVVTQLAPTLNFLAALVEGRIENPLGNPFYQGFESWLTVPAFYEVQGFSSIFVQPRVGSGWHTLFTSDFMGRGAKWLGVGSANKYRLYFGVDGQLACIDLYPDVQNPVQNAIQRFQKSGELITPWSDQQWSEISKLGLRLSGRGRRINRNCNGSPCQISVYYAIDGDESWKKALVLTGDALQEVNLNGMLGQKFRSIRLKIELSRCDIPEHSPVLDFVALEYLKLLPARQSYQLTIDASQTWAGLEPSAIRAFLERLANPDDLGGQRVEFKGWVDGVLQSAWVKLAGLQATTEPGADGRGVLRVSLVAP